MFILWDIPSAYYCSTQHCGLFSYKIDIQKSKWCNQPAIMACLALEIIHVLIYILCSFVVWQYLQPMNYGTFLFVSEKPFSFLWKNTGIFGQDRALNRNQNAGFLAFSVHIACQVYIQFHFCCVSRILPVNQCQYEFTFLYLC